MEEICLDVIKYDYPQIKRKALKRSSGQRQFGVDVEGFNASHESEVVVSCKCWQKVKPTDIVTWTQFFISHLDGHWKGKGVKIFVVAVTHPGNSDELSDAIRECHALLKPHGIEFSLWDTLHITDLVRNEVALIDRYFHSSWIEAISPRPAFEAGALDEVAALSARKLDPALPIMRAHGAPALMAHLRGELPLTEAIARGQADTRAYAKRQFTFARHQLPDFRWLAPDEADAEIAMAAG